jgi:hypothetical protein
MESVLASEAVAADGMGGDVLFEAGDEDASPQNALVM